MLPSMVVNHNFFFFYEFAFLSKKIPNNCKISKVSVIGILINYLCSTGYVLGYIKLQKDKVELHLAEHCGTTSRGALWNYISRSIVDRLFTKIHHCLKKQYPNEIAS